MSNGVKDYLKTNFRPRKRAIQQQLYKFAAQNLPDKALCVVDLPSSDLKHFGSIKRMKNSGIRVNSYYAYERDEQIYNGIYSYGRRKSKNCPGRVVVRKKDVINDLSARSMKNQKFHGKTVDLFNLDFCSAFADTHHLFQLIHGVAMHMNRQAAVIVTYSLRTNAMIKAKDAVEYAFTKTLADIYGINVVKRIDKTYKDTTPMASSCFILVKNNA